MICDDDQSKSKRKKNDQILRSSIDCMNGDDKFIVVEKDSFANQRESIKTQKREGERNEILVQLNYSFDSVTIHLANNVMDSAIFSLNIDSIEDWRKMLD